MAFHTGYNIVIKHPYNEDEEVDAVVSFDYYKGHEGSSDDPPSPPELELASCEVGGEDIIDNLSTCEIHAIECMIMDSVFGDDDFDEQIGTYPEYYNYE